jgi:hypothetical protein
LALREASVSRVRHAYHEAGHVLVSHAYGWKVDRVSLAVNGGIVRHSEPPITEDSTDEDLERGLVVLFAGREAEAYAPAGSNHASTNGGDLSVDALVSLIEPDSEIDDGPSDEQVVEHYAGRLEPERVAAARELAAELVSRWATLGRLEKLADDLLWRGELTGADIEVLLARA